MERIRLMIVDDILEIRSYLNRILAKEKDIEIIAMAASGIEAVKLLKAIRPDVVLLDIQMESQTAGIDCAEYINMHYPEIKVVILTIHREDELLFRAYSAGVMDYIIKSGAPEEIVESIREVYHNKLVLRPEIANKLVAEFTKLRTQNESLLFALNTLSKLTNSEFEVLKCVYRGENYREIADNRYVSQATIKTQINRILKKFAMRRMKDVILLLKKLDFDEIIKMR